jgi:transaldolase
MGEHSQTDPKGVVVSRSWLALHTVGSRNELCPSFALHKSRSSMTQSSLDARARLGLARPARGRAARVAAFLPDIALASRPPPVERGNQLDALRRMSRLVVDTGEAALIGRFAPQDVTTNPSLVLRALALPQYAHLAEGEALAAAAAAEAPGAYSAVADRLAVAVGAGMLDLVPGRVSTEVDARLARDACATVDRALRLLDLYAERGVEPHRVYIKVAATEEGVEACRALQKRGVDVNMTLLFSLDRAAACADAGAALVSPFVGRILDWYKAKHGRDYAPEEDPGVLSVQRIYAHYKRRAYTTTVMAASFRSAGEVRALAGCDALTIAPALLAQLEESATPLPYGLWPGLAEAAPALEADAARGAEEAAAMAAEKLSEGVAAFAADQAALEARVARALGA